MFVFMPDWVFRSSRLKRRSRRVSWCDVPVVAAEPSAMAVMETCQVMSHFQLRLFCPGVTAAPLDPWWMGVGLEDRNRK